MSNMSQFSKTSDPRSSELSDQKSEQVAEIIRKAFGLLSPEDKATLIDQLSRETRIIPATRAGEVLKSIVRFLPIKPEWTAVEIREYLHSLGMDADTRVVFNAIGYLARKGAIQKLGNGRYLVDGVGVQSYDEEQIY